MVASAVGSACEDRVALLVEAVSGLGAFPLLTGGGAAPPGSGFVTAAAEASCVEVDTPGSTSEFLAAVEATPLTAEAA